MPARLNLTHNLFAINKIAYFLRYFPFILCKFGYTLVQNKERLKP